MAAVPTIDFLTAPHRHYHVSGEPAFEAAIKTANSYDLPKADIEHFSSLPCYLSFLSSILTWTPTENVDASAIYHRFAVVYFVLNQPSVIVYQSPIRPQASKVPLTWLSTWIVDFGKEFGQYMNTPESISEETLRTFAQSPKFKIDDYVKPDGGWATFNDFFARHVKPGKRPIAVPDDGSVLVSPVDCTYLEKFPVTERATVTVKTVEWNIDELFDGSMYAPHFANGTLVHLFLQPHDYHRMHAPVDGVVLEARKILGAHYSQIEAVPRTEIDGDHSSTHYIRKTRHVLSGANDFGYQFNQTRGLIVLQTPHGLVAIVPVGMSVCSSVVIKLEEGEQLVKGDEMGYFQLGGSDMIVLFENDPIVSVQEGQYLRMGEELLLVVTRRLALTNAGVPSSDQGVLESRVKLQGYTLDT
ncbi:hypothetical protein EJ05DRAFT_493432 [Pseudovirgaria hyperparasitica]|uniref:Phosphatidylserine decarboxylase n=1 Tax=Pseudovirgaria hyperparasitica TaxID=470096 RepID=A0A6A6W1W8_9PEZI|nr:uncharacterized protein EJ05DRAFT_493432 [Pseudovirgaria hyperparasitica]KAF2756882.1 hypothetical protein EJ05DRAFT_493432 [Pseudovirgaria hyperparasitica]